MFRRKPQPVAEPAAEPVAEGSPFAGSRYDGPACFREGFYYPLLNDEHGREAGPDLEHPLIWQTDGGAGFLVHAFPTDVNHFHRYGLSSVEIIPAPEVEV